MFSGRSPLASSCLCNRYFFAIWSFSASAGHVFRIAAGDPGVAAAIAQTPYADGLAASPLVIPTGKLVRLRLQSTDVIHSYWVAELTGKTDLVPGYDNYMWYKVSEPGKWRGECAELCGSGHYTMQILVQAMTPDDYQAWVSDQVAKSKATPAPSASPSAAAGTASPSPGASPGALTSPSPSGYPAPSTSPSP